MLTLTPTTCRQNVSQSLLCHVLLLCTICKLSALHFKGDSPYVHFNASD